MYSITGYFFSCLYYTTPVDSSEYINDADVSIIGGGLAGSEAAWQAAERGLKVRLYEMRPQVSTGAHVGSSLAELVCSNSLGSNLADRASGLLKNELRLLGSLLVRIADETALPAGGALAVDREAFARQVSAALENHPNIQITRQEVREILSGLVIVASGPLTSLALSQAIVQLTGQEHLYFFDAIAPIVTLESIDMRIAYRASRYGRGVQEAGDYVNCPFSENQYRQFIDELNRAERIHLRDFELILEAGVTDGVKTGAHRFFEACLPVEILSRRGPQSLAFGPMRPVGLSDPRTGKRPYAVVQLRQDDLAGTLYNLVGFQTNLTFPEQRRVFRLIPGLENAEFVRYGQMHRNTFIFSPAYLHPTLQFVSRDDLLFAGQITGVEGYAGNIATGLLAGINAARVHHKLEPLVLPTTSMLGALCHYVTHASPADFQPMKANFGILPALEKQYAGKRERGMAYAQRAISDLADYWKRTND
jgi:methylenetetrahydrofolate--tRNA-(uracil-5-)-methyltransferase